MRKVHCKGPLGGWQAVRNTVSVSGPPVPLRGILVCSLAEKRQQSVFIVLEEQGSVLVNTGFTLLSCRLYTQC